MGERALRTAKDLEFAQALLDEGCDPARVERFLKVSRLDWPTEVMRTTVMVQPTREEVPDAA